MKILLAAIPNHHFFQWVNQLKDSGYEVYWFDVTDGGEIVSKINWVIQIKGWKLKYDYPLRHSIKNKLPVMYKYIQKYNEKSVTTVFNDLLQEIQPDIVHCFEMQLAGLPILETMQRYGNIKFIYSSWGSDIYYYTALGVKKEQITSFLRRVNYLITDCKRDYTIALQNGFVNNFLGVYPGNGGITFLQEHIESAQGRIKIMVKGYESFGCKASKIIEALELIPSSLLKNFEIVIYSADEVIVEQVAKSKFLKSLKITVLPRAAFIPNIDLLAMMGKTSIHISNNISDGMPNTLLESMGMGAFPIQSNPGNVSEEVISDGVNGYLIIDPLNSAAIATLIESAINNQELRVKAQEFNVNFVVKKFNRARLKSEIVQIYQDVFLNE